jgi:cytochrome c peroxidase
LKRPKALPCPHTIPVKYPLAGRYTALRHAFFHNGVFQTLQQVMDFYNFRDPEKVYPLGADGRPRSTTTSRGSIMPMSMSAIRPFDRHPDETPAMTAQDEADIIALLETLNDGYKPEH